MTPTKSKTIEIRNLADLRAFVQSHRPTIGELCDIIIGGLKYYPHPKDWTSCEDLLDELDLIEEYYLDLEQRVGVRQERPLFLDPGRVRMIRQLPYNGPKDPLLPEPSPMERYLWDAQFYDDFIGKAEFEEQLGGHPDPEKQSHYTTNPALKECGPGRYRDPSWPRPL